MIKVYYELVQDLASIVIADWIDEDDRIKLLVVVWLYWLKPDIINFAYFLNHFKGMKEFTKFRKSKF